MAVSFPQQLESARIGSSTAVSTTPTVLGTVEQILAAIFGYTPDLDITAGAITLSHDGKTVTVNKHLAGGGATPGIAAGTGAGTGPTISIAGTDLCGEISLTVGTTPAGINATIATVTFATAFASAPRVILCPANDAAAVESGSGGGSPVAPFVDSASTTTTHFVLKSGNTALDAGTYKWTYLVIGA